MKIKFNWKKLSLNTILAGVCILLAVLTVRMIFVRINAQKSGEAVGQAAGTIVGRAVGSFEGLTKGQVEGYKAGKEAGLTAEDTEAELSGIIRESGKLQVLAASGTYNHILSIGNDYAEVLSQKYNAVFTVDLNTAEVKLDADGLHVLLDLPEIEFIPDGAATKAAEYQKNIFTGSRDAGEIAYHEAVSQIKEEAEEEFKGNESLMETAKSSAKSQLEKLIKASSLSKSTVIVEFRGETEGAA